ncbi:unnamed protein product [Closterium sp. NIES-64]|nr:unnamed protein product [Closterium sp. NIES-64]
MPLAHCAPPTLLLPPVSALQHVCVTYSPCTCLITCLFICLGQPIRLFPPLLHLYRPLLPHQCSSLFFSSPFSCPTHCSPTPYHTLTPPQGPVLTLKLRATLARVAQGLDDAHNRPISSLSPTGPPSLPHSFQPHSPSPTVLTPKLRTTLARVAQGLDDARNKPISSLSPTGTPSERCVAMESLMWLTDMLRQTKPRFQSLLAPPAWTSMDVFYARTVEHACMDCPRLSLPPSLCPLFPPSLCPSVSRSFARLSAHLSARLSAHLPALSAHLCTRLWAQYLPNLWELMKLLLIMLDAVPDLWEHVLRTLVKLLLNIAGTADRIAAVNWEPVDIGTQHNIYVENLVAEFRLFAHRLGQSGAPRQVQDQLVSYGLDEHCDVQDQLVAYGLDELCDVMLDGICRVKKCNSNGRALMSLDLQVLVQGLQPIVGRGAVKGLQLVDNYIKSAAHSGAGGSQGAPARQKLHQGLLSLLGLPAPLALLAPLAEFAPLPLLALPTPLAPLATLTLLAACCAFYLSESQIIDWVRAHPEYTKAQVIALVVMAANGGNWKLKNKFEIIKKIDTGNKDELGGCRVVIDFQWIKWWKELPTVQFIQQDCSAPD